MHKYDLLVATRDQSCVMYLYFPGRVGRSNVTVGLKLGKLETNVPYSNSGLGAP